MRVYNTLNLPKFMINLYMLCAIIIATISTQFYHHYIYYPSAVCSSLLSCVLSCDLQMGVFTFSTSFQASLVKYILTILMQTYSSRHFIGTCSSHTSTSTSSIKTLLRTAFVTFSSSTNQLIITTTGQVDLNKGLQ